MKEDFKEPDPEDTVYLIGALYFIHFGASQTKGFRPLSDVFFPSIYRIFRASHDTNRWCIINQMFANSLPVDARVKNYR